MTPRVLLLGEALGVLRSPGPLAQAPALEVGVGGAEFNVAVGLRRLGIPSTWLGRLGADGLGRRIRRELRAEDVSVHAVDDPHPTGLLLKETDALGRTLITYHRSGSAGSRLAPEDLDGVDWPDFALLHITGITPALSASAAATIDAALAAATGNGLTVSFDINHRASLWGDRDPRPVYRRLARRADVIFAGVDEAQLLLDDDLAAAPDALAARVASEYRAEAALKLGPQGAIAALGGQTWTAPAVPTVVVDTVGAGDAFVAGYLSERLLGRDVPTRLATATVTGAALCRTGGDWEGALRRDELETLHGDPVVR